MSVYISYDNTNSHVKTGVLTEILNTVAANAGVDLKDTIEEHGWIDEPATGTDKAVWRLNLYFAEEDRKALQAHGAEVLDLPPQGYAGCTFNR